MVNGSELWKNRISVELTEKHLSSGKVITTYPGLPENLYEAVAKHAEMTPDKLAVEDSFGHRFTYGELKRTVDRFASALKYRYGVRKGDHAALMMYSCTEFSVAFLALVKLGAIAVMLPTKYRKKEICALVGKSDLRYVICDTDYSSYFEDYRQTNIVFLEYHSGTGCFGLDAFLKADDPEAKMKGTYEDISVMMFTSGTTSLSKGVLITNYGYLHAVATYQKVFRITERDSTVIPVPIYMITGLSALFGLLMYSGGTVYFQQFFKAEDVLACIQEKQVTFIHAAPTVYQLLTEQAETFPELPSLKCLACGGSRITKQLIEKIHGWLPNCQFRTVYGMTETASPATILPENAMDSPAFESNGIPIPGMKIKIVDECGNEVPAGQRGEILMNGPNLLAGYYRIDTPAYKDGWLHTGDVGYLTEDGYCYVVDRIKDMINRGGEKIISSDVEKELLQIEGIEDAAVVGIPHEVYGEAPAAVVRLKSGSTWTEDEIRACMKKRMASYKVPVKILILDGIPLTPNGKVDKKQIKKLFEM